MQKNEKDILNIIKYLPVVLILLVSSFLTFFLFNENQTRFEEENKKLEDKYIKLNKELIQFQVTKIKNNILFEKEKNLENLKIELKNQVTNAYNIAMSIYKNNSDKSKDEIIKLIKDALREIRFNENRGYLFVYERDGINILHPIKPNLENKNLWKYQDTKGTYLLQEMDRILINQKETYYSWYWTKPNDISTEYEKLGFFKVFEPFDWFIGTGEYVVDFEAQLKEKLAEEISDFRYKEDGYIFMLDHSGKYLSYHDKNIIGKSVYDLNMANNVQKIQNRMIQLAKDGGGFISYGHKDKPKEIGEISKISFIDGINDWKWLIGTGFYMDDFYEQLNFKKELLTKQNNDSLKILIFAISIFTIIFLIISVYLSKVLENKFLAYKQSIKDQINDSIKKDNMLAQQSKLAALGEMLGNITHQWKQPLSAISVIVTGIRVQRDLGETDLKFENESLEKITKHIKYLSHTIDDFRDFFKADKSANEFDSLVTINKSIELVEAQLKAKDITLIKDIDSIRMYSLENEIIQVLLNLFNNSRDELENKEFEKFIFISSKIFEKDFIKIVIRDNAGGINEDYIDKVFEPYFTTKPKNKGTGIGLFMCEEIVKKHLAGTIEVSNKEFIFDDIEYKGAEFIIIIPLRVNKTKEILS